MIQLLVDKMHRATGDLDAVLERLSLSIDAGKSRKQRRVYIEDAILERSHEVRTKQSHVARKTNELNSATLELTDDLPIVLFASFVLVAYDHRFNSTLASLKQSRRRFNVA